MVTALFALLMSCVVISDEEIDAKVAGGTPADCQDGTAEASLWFEDADEDGLGDAASFQRTCELPAGYVADQTDCDDHNNDVGAASVNYADVDGDGYGDDATALSSCELAAGRVTVGGDCNDGAANVHPGAEESDCADATDYNCDGSTGSDDADGDGFPACLDCDDADGAVNAASLWYADSDADTFGNAASSVEACAAPVGYVADATDCDDTAEGTYPAAPEHCDTVDEDCDEIADNDPVDAAEWYADADSDGYGDAAATAAACDAPADYVANDDDCDDTDAAFNPGAVEDDCSDTNDYNCDGSTGYVDGDGDGYAACEDCDDGDVTAFPGATETCDGTDDDCDGETDEADAIDPTTWYADVDADGYGAVATSVVACDAPAGYVANSSDCDDSDDSVSPAATEVCNGVDDDCDDIVDPSTATDAAIWYVDADEDGYGDSGTTVSSCDEPSGYVADATDCDDTDDAIHPGASETECTDPTDYNCDGATGYADADGDGSAACDDCDDTNAAAYPGATESCTTSFDDDCDGSANDIGATGCTTYSSDADGDTYGAASSSECVCTAAAGYVTNSTDCDDSDAETFPGAAPYDSATACENDDDGDGYGDATVSALYTEGTDLDDAKSTCTTSLTDTDGDGYYNCQDQCSDVDGDNYGTTSTAAAACVTNGGSGGTTSCAGDAACTSTDVNDAMSTCTTSLTDTDGDGYYNCQDQCSDVDGDNYGTTSSSAASCVTNGASGGTTSCAQDAACTSTDVNDAMSTCTTSGSYIDADGDGYYNCQDRCADVDGDNYGTTSTAAATCVTNGASGGTTTCAGDAACTSTDLDDAKSTCTTSLTDTDGDGYYNCQDQCSDVDGDNYGTTSSAAAACVTNGASGGTTSCAGDAACTSTDLDDAKSSCTTSLADTDGDGYYNCQDQCADVDGDNYGTTSSAAASCVTNGASGGTTTCAADAACTATDLDDAKSTCTTSLTDTDGDGYYNCQDLCSDTDGDNYGTSNSSASSCVTNGASGGTTTCAADAACTSTDVNDAMSTCTTSGTYIDTDGDGYYNCQDQCADVDGDNYGTTSSSAASCVTNGASGGTTTCAGDAACTSTDLDDAKSTCTTSLTDTDGDGYYNCQDQCSDVDGDNYGTTSSAAASCVTNGASGGTTTCAGDAACTSTDVNDAMSTCTTAGTYIDTDGDIYYDCQDRCADTDGDNYGTTSATAATCVTNGASGGSTSCAGDAACTSTDVNDAMSTCTTSGTYIDTDGDSYYDCQDRCADVDGDNYGTTSSSAASCVTNGASGGTTTCAGDAACTSTDVDDAKSTCTTSLTDTDGDGYYNCQDQCSDVDGDNYGTTSSAAASCVTNGASGGTTTCAADAACTASDLDDAKSSCTTSLTDTDGDGYYNCQDQCSDVDGDNYGTTSSAAALCVTNGASGGTTTCAGDAACTSTDVNDAMSTCTTAGTYIDTDSDGYYDCQDRCADVDGDNYGTTSTAAASCVTNGASGGSTSCAGDAACTGTDCNDASSAIYPGAADTFATNDGVDNDCDDFIDESGVAFGDVVITEFYGGNTTYTYDWIELYNNSGDTISLSSWTLELCVEADTGVDLPYDETDCDSWVTVTFPSSATVADDTYYVVCGSSGSFTTTADCDLVITSYDSPAYTTSTDLENGSGGVSLDLASTVIDDVYWWQHNGNDDWPADDSTAITAQLTSIQLGLDTITGVSPDPADANDDYSTSTSNPFLDDIWCTSEDAGVTNDWAASFTLVGTPGAANVACP